MKKCRVGVGLEQNQLHKVFYFFSTDPLKGLEMCNSAQSKNIEYNN